MARMAAVGLSIANSIACPLRTSINYNGSAHLAREPLSLLHTERLPVKEAKISDKDLWYNSRVGYSMSTAVFLSSFTPEL